MNNHEQNPKPDDQLELSMKWEQAFRDILDDVWWPGYSQQLFEENPEGYQKEYFYFIALYDEPPSTEH